MNQKEKLQHIIPLRKNFLNDKAKLLKLLSYKMSFDRYGENFNPYSMLLDDDIIEQIEEANNIIIIALDAIIKNYFYDKDIQNILNLSKKALRLLEKCSKTTYKLGSIRPDFLITADDKIKICEINARFLFNGILATQYLRDTYNKTSTSDYISINQYPNILTLVLENFDLSQPIIILRDREKGYDMNFLEKILKENLKITQNQISITPKELTVSDGGLLFKGQKCEQFIIELHQDELLGLSDNFLEALIKTNYINDLRTILIGHDKRLLAAFSSQDIMLRYISMEEFRILNKYIIQTYIPNNEINKKVIANKNHWVLKKYGGGKGIGMYVGKIHSTELIERILKNEYESYIIQPYLFQKKIPIYTEFNKNIDFVSMHVVGFFANFNRNFLGAGFLRVSSGDIVNVSEQGGSIINVVEKNYIHKNHVINNLNYIISYAKKYSEYYSKALPIGKIKTLEEFGEFPILKGSTLKKYASNANCSLLTDKLEFCYIFTSGGTTGAPKFGFRSYEENNTNAKMLAKGLRMCGLQKNDVVANLLTGEDLWPGMTIFNIALQHIGCCILSLGEGYEQNFLIELIRRFKITTLLGIPTQIASLAHYIEEKDIKDICIPRIITGGEHLYEGAKKYIKKVLKVRHFQSTGYTSSDTGAIGYQCIFCDDNEYHLHSNMQHLEILNLNNDNPVSFGEKGRIVVTNLDRTLMPLIRYEIGDMGRMLDKDCQCHSADPKFQLLGRCDDNINIGTDTISIDFFANALAKFEELSSHFQILIANTNGIDYVTIISEIKNQEKISKELKKSLYDEISSIIIMQNLITKGLIGDIFINIVPYGSIARNPKTGKIRNIIDERK